MGNKEVEEWAKVKVARAMTSFGSAVGWLGGKEG